MTIHRIGSLGLGALLAIAVAGPARSLYAGSVTYEILVDTSGLVPGPGGFVDIQLSPSTVPSSATVTASVFGANPIGDVGAVTFTNGTAAGDLSTPAGVTMNNSQAGNEQEQNFTVSSFFDVFVTLSGSEIGPGATGPFTGTVFNFSLFDSGSGSLQATLTVNPNGGLVDGTIGITTSGLEVIVTTPVPEPSSIVLLCLGLGAVVAIGRQRSR
jgi:PEP-CTERM motif